MTELKSLYDAVIELLNIDSEINRKKQEVIKQIDAKIATVDWSSLEDKISIILEDA